MMIRSVPNGTQVTATCFAVVVWLLEGCVARARKNDTSWRHRPTPNLLGRSRSQTKPRRLVNTIKGDGSVQNRIVNSCEGCPVISNWNMSKILLSSNWTNGALFPVFSSWRSTAISGNPCWVRWFWRIPQNVLSPLKNKSVDFHDLQISHFHNLLAWCDCWDLLEGDLLSLTIHWLWMKRLRWQTARKGGKNGAEFWIWWWRVHFHCTLQVSNVFRIRGCYINHNWLPQPHVFEFKLMSSSRFVNITPSWPAWWNMDHWNRTCCRKSLAFIDDCRMALSSQPICCCHCFLLRKYLLLSEVDSKRLLFRRKWHEGK